jgi:hypothetical protein
MRAPRIVCWAASLTLGLVLFFATSTARAYPWMIRHEYTGCVPCHTDPSGGAGALTEYGRAQSDLLLRTHYGPATEEADRTAGFLLGAPLPPELRLGGDFREAFFSNKVEGTPVLQKFITMRLDLYGDVKVGRFRAAGSIGFAPSGDLPASLTSNPTDNIVSREHWVGAELDEEGAYLLRGGRLTLPFGIRMIEHNLWARTLTRTDLDATQQYGVALSFARDKLRGEVMGILGNFLVSPDDFRERGYSAYAEFAPTTTLALGASSLFTRATRDIGYGVTDYRYANGLFARYSPFPALVVLGEGDWIYQSLTWMGHRSGYAGFLQADYESVHGVHLMATGELMNGGARDEPTSFDAWLSAVWFFLPHVDIRFDGIYSSLGIPPGGGQPPSHESAVTWLLQFHVFL